MLVDDEIKKQRMDICINCEFLINLKRCSKCGCFMPVKTQLKKSKCPIGKWEIITEEKL